MTTSAQCAAHSALWSGLEPRLYRLREHVRTHCIAAVLAGYIAAVASPVPISTPLGNPSPTRGMKVEHEALEGAKLAAQPLPLQARVTRRARPRVRGRCTGGGRRSASQCSRWVCCNLGRWAYVVPI
ncbi:hypothetical protein OH76DRAFT_249568 [Lentinus brumalis]|uniref:Uncharacterized protein n=1 Tax=Lentinus brumalis TaxID=2498619 RepID=A0A371CLP1_9APHY|nr:hypothetical protein OH76DRAFT_249568 [Polyporus brumalis]